VILKNDYLVSLHHEPNPFIMRFNKILPLVCLLIAFTFPVFAQVTTSSLVGTVTDAKGQPLVGATVKATHVPSGTIYGTVTQGDGQFTLPNMRVGGPYTIVVSYIGYNTRTYTGLSLQLGAPLSLDAVLEPNANALSEVTVTYNKNAIISPEHVGASTNISQEELSTLPTINRNIDDYARLVPQAQPRKSSTDGSTQGISFAGESNRYNQFTIDGANSTDIFGLAATGTNGGQASINPIPFDAIDQVQIILDPYDVTLSGFTGGGVNAVTRSGTNEIHGSAYGFNQSQSLVGKGPDGNDPYGTFHDWVYGARVGGPIIKNKLFYFVNFEAERRSQPVSYQPGTSTSQINTDSLNELTSFLENESLHKGWSYNPGPYNGFNANKQSNSIFARIDWNINEKNKLTIRNSFVKGYNFIFSDAPSSMSFYNNGYNFNTQTNSTVAELNSNFSSKTSNMLRLTYTATQDSRATPGQLFPTVSINDNGATYNFGTEYSSQANALNQNNFTFTDNFNIYAEKHTITIGTDDELYSSHNLFLQGVVGSYAYSSLASFYADASGVDSEYATSYKTAYSTNPNNPRPFANVHTGQFSLYAQDNYAVKDNFKLTYGLRADMIDFFGHPPVNAAFNSSDIATANDVSTNEVPKAQILLSPRVGFNWDVKDRHTTQIRGGIGIFTGRAPFVWISDQYSNTGVGVISSSLNSATVVSDNVHFNPVTPYQPTTGGVPIINVTSKNFKYPRVMRTNLALDQKLPYGIIGTIEAMYTKTLDDILYYDLNLAPSTATLELGNTTRPFYGSKVNSSFSNVIELTNTHKGYGYNFTVSLDRPFSKGWTASLAYSLGHSYALNDGTSSVALSNYRYAYNINGLGHLDLARTNYDQGSRIVGYISKRFNYGIFSTDIGLVYTGQSGQPFSYVFYGDLNGDDGSTLTNPNHPSTSGGADLMYVPADASQFVLTSSQQSAGMTTQQVYQEFLQYIDSDKYLKKHIGQNTSRNGDRLPWENHFDLKISEDIRVYKQNTLTITANIFNVSNLLDHNWGKAYYASNQEEEPLNVDHFVVNGNTVTPYFYYNPTYGLDKYTNKPYSYSDYLSRWSMQLGLRYSF
jgi:outer membrane receptor for ferrienterochelin and colicin